MAIALLILSVLSVLAVVWFVSAKVIKAKKPDRDDAPPDDMYPLW